MEMGSNVVQSTALYWYGMLGNALGGGRPSWTVSTAPLSCTQGNRAPICASLATTGITYTATGACTAATARRVPRGHRSHCRHAEADLY